MRSKRNNKYACPFCGVRPSKQYYLRDRIKKVGLDAYQVGTELEFELPKEPTFYYKCNGCQREYEDISSLNIKNIRAKQNVLYDKILRIYGNKLRFEKLINRRIAIVRIIGGSFNKILKLFRRRFRAMIIISVNQVRSFMTFTRKKTPDGEYYLAESLERLA